MSGQASGKEPVMYRGSEATKPPPKSKDLARAEKIAAKKGKKRDRSSNAKRTLSERMPAGVYDERPVMKRYTFHWLYFWLYARLGLYKTGLATPRASKRELESRRMSNINAMSSSRQPTVACPNSKGGGGKTIVATYLAVGSKRATGRETVLTDANQSKGHVLSRFGFDRNEASVLLRGFLRYERELSTNEQINLAFVQDPVSNVLLLGSESTGTTGFSQSLFIRRMETLKTCTHTHVLDAGNGDDTSATRGAVSVADVLVFPANTQQPDSFEDLIESREAYAKLGFEDKVNAGIIVLFGLSKSKALEMALKNGWDPDKVVPIPKDPYMVDLKIVRWRKLRIDTRLAMLDVVEKVFQATPEVEPWNTGADAKQNASHLDLDVTNEPVGRMMAYDKPLQSEEGNGDTQNPPSIDDARVPQLVIEGR